MKIAFIGIKGLPAKWGADRVVEAIVQRLSSRHEITIYCSSREIPKGTSYPGIRLVRVPCLPGKFTHMASVNLMAALHAFLYGNYDLIHSHNIEAAFVLPLLRLRYIVVSTAHGRITSGNKWGRVASRIIRLMESPFARWSTVATSVSKNDAREIGLDYHREVLYIPNGIDAAPLIDEKEVASFFENRGIISQKYIVFVAGRIIPLKGAHLLLSAYSRLQTEDRLLVVGDLSQSPEYAERLKSMADARVIFVPFVSSISMLLGLMKHSFILVFPSLSEGMSMTLLEAASVGAPVLCSDIPANTDILPEQALYFSSGDVDDLAAKLKWAMEHPLEMQVLGNSAKAWARLNYSWDTVAARYENLYCSLVKTN